MQRKYIKILRITLIIASLWCPQLNTFAHQHNSPNLSTSVGNEASLRTVIGGSYRKHLKSLMQLKKNLQSAGIIVLSPVGELALNPDEKFIILNADPVHDPRILQDSIFAKIRTSSFYVVANIDGYIGSATMLEIGYALANGLQVLTIEAVDDPNLAPYCRPITEVFPNILSNI